ncbi:hypothetical protein [Alkalicoccus luteus]|uniref:hypothetical protein n=1 Tax=Alkalicoccus luteus TaxID=1237094 RepID=UPI004033CE27
MVRIVGTSIKDAFQLLRGSWLNIIGVVVLAYVIKLVFETLPVQGTVQVRMEPLTIANTNNLLSLALAAAVNSVLFFIIIDYITKTAHTMRRRFWSACAYPFKQWSLLYKGTAVFFMTYLLLDVVGTLFMYGGILGLFGNMMALQAGGAMLLAFYAGIFTLLIWILLGISQVGYILYEYPEKSLLKSIRESFTMMKGYRLSLLGLFVLAVISILAGALLFIIGAIVMIVVYEVVRLAFYQELKRRKRREEWHSKVNAGA